MNEHLALASVQPGSHCILVLDGAGWHKSKELPENITLLLLPPYSPELKENVVPETESLRESRVQCARRFATLVGKVGYAILRLTSRLL